MARYEITSPKGERFEITAPDHATEQDVLSYAQKQFSRQSSTTPEQDLALAKQVVQERPNTLAGKLAFGSERGETFPQYAGRSLKEMAIPMVTTAAGSTLGPVGAAAGSAFGEYLNQTTGIYPRSAIPEMNEPDMSRVGVAAIAPLAIPAIVGGAKLLKWVGKKTGEATIPKRFVESFLRDKTGSTGPELAKQLTKPVPFSDWASTVPNAPPPLYPSTAAEKVANVPGGEVLQEIEKVVARTPGDVSRDFAQRILDQRAALTGARNIRQAEVGPALDKALEKANFGKQIPVLEALAKQRLAGVERFAPKSPQQPPPTDMLKSAVGLHAPYTSPTIETTAEKVAKQTAAELYGKAQADAKAMFDLKDIIKQQGFQPLSTKGLISEIDKQLSDPKIGSISVAEKVLGKVKDRLTELSKSGVIDAEALQNVRRQDLGNFINQAMKETGTSDKKQTAGVANAIQSSIDRAIEQSGGKGWTAAMGEWSKRTQDIKDALATHVNRYKPLQPVTIQGVNNMAEASGRHLLPNWLSRPVTGFKWLQDIIASKMEPHIDRRMADLMLGQQTPLGVSHEGLAGILRERVPSRAQLMIQELMKRQAPIAAGAATLRE